MAPFLWMGFNCLKATATSRRQFTFYHSVPRNSWFPEICEIYSKLTLICQNDIIDYILVSLVLTLEICHSCWCFFFFWYFYCLTLNEWSFAENVNYWKSLKAKRDRDMFEISLVWEKVLFWLCEYFFLCFFLIRYTGIEVLYIRVGRPGLEPEVILVLWIYQECNAARNW